MAVAVTVAPKHYIWGNVELDEDSSSVSFSERLSSGGSGIAKRLAIAKQAKVVFLTDNDSSDFSSSALLQRQVVASGSPSVAPGVQAQGARRKATGTEDENIAAPVVMKSQLDVTPALYTIGSQLHDEGLCSPCSYFPRQRGCLAGETCTFCHLSHERRKHRPPKGVRDRCKRAAKTLDVVDLSNKIEYANAIASLPGMGNPYMNLLVEGKLRDRNGSGKCADTVYNVIRDEDEVVSI